MSMMDLQQVVGQVALAWIGLTFNSAQFAFLFFPAVYAGYLALVRSRRLQNILLLAASYFVYASFGRRFVFLLAFTTFVDFSAALLIDRLGSERARRAILALSIGSNLVVLGIFKYFDFFAANAAQAFALFGLRVDPPTLQLVLPIGISFYTFQSISYVVEVYRRTVTPTRSILDYALYVAFFPHLMAGPIQRISLLRQIAHPRRISAPQIDAAIFLLLWGYFKKTVIADNSATIVASVFGGEPSVGLDTVAGIVAFTLQIYCDFSGYSDIARGLAKLMGFELMVNFALPYFARSPAEFWRRWHISLSTWLRDYLYVPLGGSRAGRLATYRNLMVTMLLGGLWHGASWTFVLWGAYHGALLVAQRFLGATKGIVRLRVPPVIGRSVATLATFALVMVGWVFFRATSVEHAVAILGQVGLSTSARTAGLAYDLALIGLPLLGVEAWQHRSADLLAPAKASFVPRIALYSAIVIGLFLLGVRDPVEFIYFQF